MSIPLSVPRDQQDAYPAEWLRRADMTGTLSAFLIPALAPLDPEIAEIEDWILGIAPIWRCWADRRLCG